MPTESEQFRLSNGNREALIIRWRVILILGLQDFFTNEQRFTKIVATEILDMFEGVIKAFAEALGIQIENIGFTQIFNQIKECERVPLEKRHRLEEINNSLSADELNSLRNIIRNPEAHTLNLPSIPVESVLRCWRLFMDTITICDRSLLIYVHERPEFNNFFSLHTFFYKHVVHGEYIDLRTIKLYDEYILKKNTSISEKNIKGKEVEIKYKRERTTSELVDYISLNRW